MFRSLFMLLAIALASGCTQEAAENPNPAREAEPVTLESPDPEHTRSSGIISAEREAVSTASGLPQPKTETGLLDCQPMNDTSVYCGYQNPEDLVVVPDGSALVVSEMGEFMLDTPGGLSMLDLTAGERGEIAIDWSGADAAWGAEGCSTPDVAAFSPHGIDLMTRPDGLHQLLVVNHGKRESVEFFELLQEEGNWVLAWRGCAVPPGDPFINDVAGLADGGFFVTHMWNKRTPFEKVVEQFTNGENIGWVWEWQPESGFTKLLGSDELMPNGIAVSPDNSKIFVNIYLGNKTIRMDRESGEVEGSFEVQQPDNITVDEEGSLWIASHKHDPLGQTCAAVTEGPCLLPYEVLKVDPGTLDAVVVIAENRPPMGYATVALRVGGRLYMGSAHGDRVASRAIANPKN